MKIKKGKITKKAKDLLIGYTAGMFGSMEPSSVLHEAGHAVAIKMAGGEPEFHLLDKFFDPSGSMYVSYTDKFSGVIDSLITAAGPLTNAGIAATSLVLSSKVKNRKFKYALKGVSLVNALYLGLYSLSDYTGITHGDFSSLASNGIGYEYTVPLSMAGLAAVSAHLYMSEKKKKKDNEMIPVSGEFYDIE